MNANLREAGSPGAAAAGPGADWALRALEQHPVAHTLLGGDGRVRWLNQASARLLNCAASSVIGLPWEQIKPCYAGKLDLQTPTVPSEHTWLRRDGRVGFFRTQIVRQHDGSLLLIENDVTDMVRAVGDEDQRLERLRQLVSGGPDTLLIADAKGRVLCHSDSLLQLLGYQPNSFVDRNVFELVHPEDLTNLRARIASGAVIHSPNTFQEFIFRSQHSDGSWRWTAAVVINALTTPNVEAAIVGLRDATGQVEIERALHARDRRFAALTEHSNDMIAVLGVCGRVSFESASVTRILGYPPLTWTARKLFRAMHPSSRSAALDALRALRANAGIVQTLEVLMRAADGQYRWLEAVCIDLANEPDINGMLVTARDITTRKNAELERDAAIDCGGIALWEYDVDNKMNRWIGAGVPELYGTVNGKFSEADYFEHIHPDDVEAVRSAYLQLEADQLTELQVNYRTRDRDGRWRWIYERSRFAGRNTLTGARRLAGVSIDITAQRSTEELLVAARNKLQFAIDSLGIGCYEWDITRDVVTGLDDWCLRHGLPKEGHPGIDARWDSYVHPDDHPQFERRRLAHLRGDADYFDIEYRLRRGDGRWVWLLDRTRVVERDADGNRLRVIGVLVNIDDRKRIESALLASEARLSTAIWGGSFGLWEMDVPTQSTRWLSDWCEREDLDPCEADHVASWDTHIHPDDVEAAVAAFSRMTDNQTDSFEHEYRVRTRSGTWKWIFERSRAIERAPDGQPTKIAGLCINIDERKRAEIELRDTQRAMQTIAANSPDWLFLLDKTGRVSYANRVVLGLSPTEMLGRPVVDLSVDDEAMRGQVARAVSMTLAGREESLLQTIEASPASPKRYLMHRMRPVQENGRTVGALVTSSDVTKERERDQLMRLQAHVLNTIREGVVLLDNDHVIRLSNPAFDRMCGASQSELLGMPIEALLLTSPDRLLAGDEAVQCTVRRLDGSQFAAAAVVTPMDVNNEPHRLIVLNDVTERKLLEREILEVSSLEQQRIGNDLHDGLGQELTGVALMLRALAKRIDNEFPHANAEVGEIVALVNHSIESTRALARGLSPVSIERGGLLPALETLALRARAAYGIAIRLRRFVRKPPRLDADEATHLYRIVQEALTNAVRHGRATRISIAIVSDTDFIEVSVRDNGKGLAQSDTRRGGIGLKTMKYRAQMLEGELTLSAARGGGTVVRCRCPQGSVRPVAGARRRPRLQVTRILAES